MKRTVDLLSQGLGDAVDTGQVVDTRIGHTPHTTEVLQQTSALLRADARNLLEVWTGTSREPTYYNGIKKERVFENAYLEYGSMESMTAPTGRKMFFLTDPIEDRPRDWEDFKRNYEATFTAQLSYPKTANYEIMPWPDRIYEGLYLNPSSGKKELIPRSYSTQMQIMVNALNEMPVSENRLDGAAGFSVLMANSLMF